MLGQFLGCSVAVALALRCPDLVGSLVLLRATTFRVCEQMWSQCLVPPTCDWRCDPTHTITPPCPPLMAASDPQDFWSGASTAKIPGGLSEGDDIRPSQIRASAAESTLMISDAFAARGHYAESKCPSSSLLARRTGSSTSTSSQHDFMLSYRQTLHRVPGVGHGAPNCYEQGLGRNQGGCRAGVGSDFGTPRAA